MEQTPQSKPVGTFSVKIENTTYVVGVLLAFS